MKMTTSQESELKTLLKNKCPAERLPDMCWVNPLGIVCLFLNGRVVNTPEIAWQIYKEERASRTSSIEQFHEWIKELPAPSIGIVRDILSCCLRKEITTAEMGRMVENRADNWITNS